MTWAINFLQDRVAPTVEEVEKKKEGYDKIEAGKGSGTEDKSKVHTFCSLLLSHGSVQPVDAILFPLLYRREAPIHRG